MEIEYIIKTPQNITYPLGFIIKPNRLPELIIVRTKLIDLKFANSNIKLITNNNSAKNIVPFAYIKLFEIFLSFNAWLKLN